MTVTLAALRLPGRLVAAEVRPHAPPGRSVSWVLSFSFARALQDPALATWHGDHSKVTSAQDAFGRRARLNGLAQQGRYGSATDARP